MAVGFADKSMSELEATHDEAGRSIRLPNGTEIPGTTPVVVIGPNGSGKTRQARDLQTQSPPEFINALRNTRIQLNVPAMSYTDAENQFVGQRDQSRSNHWDWNNEFDYLLASLLAQHATTAIKFMDAAREGESDSMAVAHDTLQRIRDMWADVFPGRRLVIDDYRPVIISTVYGDEVTYSAQTMSDGERAAIYLAGRVLRARASVLVIDEPETHLHSLLATQFWNALEAARPDVRFVYITHDLTFARSRRDATGLRGRLVRDRSPRLRLEAVSAATSEKAGGRGNHQADGHALRCIHRPAALG
jgi:ATPase subunit of ABC transporter with duplicated ATPase domains